MKAIEALEFILNNGIDNSRAQTWYTWGEQCKFLEVDNVKYAEVLFGHDTTILEVYRYTPVDRVLLVWRNQYDDDSEFRAFEQPIVVAKCACGAVCEVYELE
jgi:hypothetical protein